MADRAAWRNVWLLAATSFVADVSGEMLQAVLPFVLFSQGATGIGLGLVGGLGEGVGHATKLLGGWLGTRMRRRVPLVGAGYLLAALSRFGIAGAGHWSQSLVFRSMDRVGKGLRTAPRDAILADQVPPSQRGRAFGLHRAGDTAGAVVGILIALGMLLWLGGDDAESLAATERTIVLVGAFVGLASVAPLFLVRERPDGTDSARASAEPARPGYRGFLGVSAVFYLGHVSYLFLILRGAQPLLGLAPPVVAVLWYLGFNVVYMAASYPAGILTDRFGRVKVLAAGYGLSALGYLLFILHPSPWTLAAGFLALGLSYAATEGTGRALAADLSGSAGRSTRLGWFHFTVGGATVAGGLAAGWLWDAHGEAAAFIWGLGASVAALAALAWWAPMKWMPMRRDPQPSLRA